MNKLNITWCYPDILSLHGDRGNIMALERIAGEMHIECRIHKVVNYGDPIDFEQTDILFFNPGEFKSNEYVINALSRQKEKLDRYVEGNKVLAVIGTSGAAFGKKIERIGLPDIAGLGYLDMTCRERDSIVGDDLICTMRGTGFELNGSQIQVMDTFLNRKEIALADVSYGYGNCGYEQKLEGARYKNLFFTNLLGPVLVKNPWLTQELIKEAMRNKGVAIEHSIPYEAFDLEIKSMECIRKYNEKKATR